MPCWTTCYYNSLHCSTSHCTAQLLSVRHTTKCNSKLYYIIFSSPSSSPQMCGPPVQVFFLLAVPLWRKGRPTPPNWGTFLRTIQELRATASLWGGTIRVFRYFTAFLLFFHTVFMHFSNLLFPFFFFSTHFILTLILVLRILFS